ncbi:MAG: sterol desaturase family protein [Hyphomonadaceae bacterium]|nr:sterol desaturase family protein [Hyphomonadaceae bacterium]
MTWAERALIVVLSTAAMEGVAWAVHRYVMHGWGWGWHASHHAPRTGLFEKNDLFAVVFAALAVGLFTAGRYGWEPLWWIALGMTAYGVLYALAHDVLVHRRLPGVATPKRGYLLRLHQAHHLHHAVHTRQGAVSFGFLLAPDPRHLRARLAERRAHQIPEQEELAKD